MATTVPPGSATSAERSPARVVFVFEGARSREDHAALLQVAEALAREGAETPILHHGLGRLAVLRLRRTLYRLRPDLIVVTGASSTRDVRRVATILGCPLVCYSWPDGAVHNIHDKHDRAHALAHALARRDLVPPTASAAPPQPRPMPTRVVVASPEQQREVERYFAQPDSPLAVERVHILPLLPEPPAPHQGSSAAPPIAANAAALAEHTALLWEVLTERAHRSIGHGMLRGMVAQAAKLGPRPASIALAYHQVRREVRGFDLNLVIAEGTLERQVRALLRRGYRAVTVAEQAELVLAERGEPAERARRTAAPPGAALPPGGPTFSISFDDGYVDTLTIAAPLLASLKVPFTVYVISDIVTGVRPLPWYDLVAHALLSRELRPAALRVLAREPALLAHAALAASCPPPLLAQLALAGCKALPGARREALVDALWAEVGPRVQALPATPRYLDADGVRRLRDFSAEISSHTRSHPILPQLTDAALRDELHGSREQLCQLFGSCTGLAYPNGDSDPRVWAAAQAAGYTYAVGVTPQAGTPSRYHLGRRMLSELSGLGIDGRFSEDVLWARIRGALG